MKHSMSTETNVLELNLQMQEEQHLSSIRICRLCMAEDECSTSMIDIFCDGTTVLATIISSVTQLEISERDGLPANICKQCIDQLNLAHEFKERCLTSDITLRKLYSKEPLLRSRSASCLAAVTENPDSLFEPQVKLETILSCDSHSIGSEDDEEIDELTYKNKDETQILLDTAANSSTVQITKPQSKTNICDVRTNRGNSPLYQCNCCKKTFLHQETLVEHLQTHATEPRYKCVWCDRIFSRKDVLTRHIRTHTGEQPYRCQTCSKSFTQKETLVRHMHTHSGYQPHQCAICGRAFSQMSHLNTHMWSHNQDKSFSCNVCNKTFSLKTSLNRHMRTHETTQDFKCTVCDRFFMRKATLVSHMRSHTGEHPYQCEVCMMTFSLRASLTRHFRTHVQHHVYQCTFCAKNFTRKDTLTRHLLTHAAAANALGGS